MNKIVKHIYLNVIDDPSRLSTLGAAYSSRDGDVYFIALIHDQYAKPLKKYFKEKLQAASGQVW